MALPVIFANQTSPLQLMWLDQDFAAVGALTTIPCVIVGTNALVLTQNANTPTVVAYSNYQVVSGIAPATNTGAVTVQVGTLAALPVYIDTLTGPAALTGGEIIAGNFTAFVYDSALNSMTGGFHLFNRPPKTTWQSSATASVSTTVGITLTAAQITGNSTGFGILSRSGPTVGFADVTPPATSIVAALPGIAANGTFEFLVSNGTTVTQTITAGTSVTMTGGATIAAGTNRVFNGVVTNIATPAVVLYG